MSEYVYDYASARPQRSALVNAVGVARYIKRDLPNDFNLVKAERDEILEDWRLGLLHNAEQSAGDTLNQSTSWWRDYGKICSDRLQAYGTKPKSGVSIAVSTDTDITSSAQLSRALQSYEAFKVGLAGNFDINVYAEPWLCDHLLDPKNGIMESWQVVWLPSAWGWASGYSYSEYLAYPHAGLVQQYGDFVPGTDRNIVKHLSGLGMQWPTGMTHTPGGISVIAPGFQEDPSVTALSAADLNNALKANSQYYLPRLASVLASGQGNAAFYQKNVGEAVNNFGGIAGLATMGAFMERLLQDTSGYVRFTDAPTKAGRDAIYAILGPYRLHVTPAGYKAQGTPPVHLHSIKDEWAALPVVPGTPDPIKES